MPISHLQDRAVLRLSGPDTRVFLQGLLTADVDELRPDTPLHAGLLSPQGKALFQLFLFAEGEDVLIDVNIGQAEALAKRLAMFRLRRQVAVDSEPELKMWQAWGEPSVHPVDPRTALAGSRFPSADGAATGDEAAWHALRLALGLPDSDEIGQDELLWLETNGRELNGVSFTKGCYTGQENTARMHHRDKLRKRLLPVRTSGDGPLMAGEREAGTWRGTRHGDLRMALFRVECLHQPLNSGGEPAHVILPPWLPADG